MAAAHTLLKFAAAATRSLAQPGGMPPWFLGQVTSACGALESCIILALCAPQLSGQTAFKLGAASCLVFGPGRTALAACAAAHWAAASHEPTEVRLMVNLASRQLNSVALLMSDLLDPISRPEAAAAFANSTAKPPALLPWLAALSIAVPQIGAGCDEGEYRQRSPVAAGIVRLHRCWICPSNPLAAPCPQNHGSSSPPTICSYSRLCSAALRGPGMALPSLPTRPCSKPLRACCWAVVLPPQQRQQHMGSQQQSSSWSGKQVCCLT